MFLEKGKPVISLEEKMRTKLDLSSADALLECADRPWSMACLRLNRSGLFVTRNNHSCDRLFVQNTSLLPTMIPPCYVFLTCEQMHVNGKIYIFDNVFFHNRLLSIRSECPLEHFYFHISSLCLNIVCRLPLSQCILHSLHVSMRIK